VQGVPADLLHRACPAYGCCATVDPAAVRRAAAELGDLEAAGRYYDMCITAIQTEAQQPLSSTWDMS
jgi:hypothetical protein